MAAGLSVSQGTSPIIEGDIQRFLYDWIGFVEVDFYLDIDFRIVRNGKVAFAYNARRAHKRAPKSAAQAQDSEAIRSTIPQNDLLPFFRARAKGQFTAPPKKGNSPLTKQHTNNKTREGN